MFRIKINDFGGLYGEKKYLYKIGNFAVHKSDDFHIIFYQNSLKILDINLGQKWPKKEGEIKKFLPSW